MSLQTVLTRRLGLQHPIIQAPLAGGGDTPDLVAAVAEAGALGFIGAAYLTPPQIAEAARAVRARTARPFGINLFAPLPAPLELPDASPALERVAPFYAELGLAPPSIPASASGTFDDQLRAALESGASVFSFTFGVLTESARDAVKERGMFLIGTATTVDEALALEKAGVEAIVTQGSEAGGHRGTFAGDFDGAMVGTMALVPQVVDAVAVPVIASGGIMDGRGIAAALALGAGAVQMGLQGRHHRGPRTRHANHPRLFGSPGARHRQPLHARGRSGWWRRRHPAFSTPERLDATAPDRGSSTRPCGVPVTVGGASFPAGAAPEGGRSGRTPGRRSRGRRGSAREMTGALPVAGALQTLKPDARDLRRSLDSSTRFKRGQAASHSKRTRQSSKLRRPTPRPEPGSRSRPA